MAMAANCARTTFLRLTTSASSRTALVRPSLSSTAASAASSSSSKRSSPSRLFSDSLLLSRRAPVELGGAMTLMPLHNVTASALMTSLLCLSSRSWGCLSEGFATPL